MNYQVKKIFAFEISGVIIFIAFMIFILEYAFCGQETRIDKLYSAIREGEDIELAIVGNSHEGALGNMKVFGIDKVANYSIGGQDIFHSYEIINEILKSSPQINHIILGLDYDLLGYSLNTTNQKHIARQYYKYTDTLEDMSASNLLMAKSNFFRANRDFKLLFNGKHNISNDVSHNFIPLANENSDIKDLCEKRAIEMTSVKFTENIISDNQEYLSMIIDLTNQYNVNLIILVLPKRQCFYEMADINNTKLGRDALYDVINDKKSNFHFMDLYGDENFPDSCFIDPDHMNANGIKVLQEIFSIKY